MPPAVTVIEILENVQPTKLLREELVKYKQEGYFLAIDDFKMGSPTSQFFDIADIIKVDILDKTEQEIEQNCKAIAHTKALKLAEKVESGAAYRLLQKFGFDLFQGYFFARPETLSGKKITSSQASKVRVMAALQEKEIDICRFTELIHYDPGIAYRLLRLLNSAAFGFSVKIESIEHAVMLLGSTRMRYWLQMVIMSDINVSRNPRELFHLALMRGKILEELTLDGHISKEKPATMFLFGLLSLLDIMLNTSFEKVFNDLPLSPSFQEGYLNPESEMAIYLNLLKSIEDNNIEALEELSGHLAMSPRDVTNVLMRAHAWTDCVMDDII